ncbi:reverse transcriptase domain-containing protein [Tanacetum coccineum]
MTKKYEEKTVFHTEEGVFCYMIMPFDLKNVRATYQRLVDSVFKDQIWINLEAYVDDMVIKSQTEQYIIKDVEETFSTLWKINMKLNPKKCSFGMEGKFLGYIATSVGIRANLEKTKSVMDMPSPRTLKQIWTDAAKVVFLEMKKLVSELPTLTTLKKGETLMMYLFATDEALAGAFNRFQITYILRAKNRKADALSKLAAVQFDHLSKEVLVKVLNEHSIETQEVNMVVEEEGPTWITPIRDYLVEN